MSSIIIFENEKDGISLISHTNNEVTLEQLISAVPKGKKYKIIDYSELPETKEDRDFWTADFTTFDGIGGE